jgi:hypothetical protein
MQDRQPRRETQAERGDGVKDAIVTVVVYFNLVALVGIVGYVLAAIFHITMSRHPLH